MTLGGCKNDVREVQVEIVAAKQADATVPGASRIQSERCGHGDYGESISVEIARSRHGHTKSVVRSLALELIEHRAVPSRVQAGVANCRTLHEVLGCSDQVVR